MAQSAISTSPSQPGGLPEELLLQILLQPNIRPKNESGGNGENAPRHSTMYNLCLTGKTFHRLCLPFQYEHVDLRKDTKRRLVKLVRALVEKPDLARFVRELRLGYVPDQIPESWQDDTWRTFWLDATAVLYGSLLSRDLVLRAETALGRHRPHGDVYLLILLCMCTRLEVLEYEAGEIFLLTESLFYEAISAPVARQTSTPENFPLEKLREIAVSASYEHCPEDIAHLRLPYLTLPSLRTFRGIALSIYHDSLVLISHTIERVELRKLDITSGRVGQLIYIFPNMKHLSIQWGELDVGIPEVRFDDLGIGLRGLCTGLRSLHLDAKKHWWTHDAIATPRSISNLGSLRELKSLTELSLQAIMFTGRPTDSFHLELPRFWRLAETLPSSLRVLEITSFDQPDVLMYATCTAEEYENAFDEELIELMGDEAFSGLRKVQMTGRKTPATSLVTNASLLGWTATAGVDHERDERTHKAKTKAWIELARSPAM